MDDRQQRGFALLGVLLLAGLLAALVAGYFSLTRVEMSTVDSSMDSIRGFYAAEAGSNIRAELVRQTFVGYNRPVGVSPDTASATPPCEGVNVGSGDFACSFYGFQDRAVRTYLEESPGNPVSIVIPRGELFQDLHAQEFQYNVRSEARSPSDRTEAVLELLFRSRLVPMFQFAVFYNKDLEILPQPLMNLGGPVHTNGDLYVGSGHGLNVEGQVSTAGDLYHGRKASNSCMVGGVSVIDPSTLSPIPACSGTRRQILPAEVVPWNEMIQLNVDQLDVPPPETFDPIPGAVYWDKADLRIVLNLNGATPEIEVRRPDHSLDSVLTAALTACGSATHAASMYNHREGSYIEMLDVDAGDLLDCIHLNGLLGVGKGLDDTSEGGLVWYLGVDGPDSATFNNYGVRVRGGAELKSSDVAAPAVVGLTVVTNQAAYVQGSFNAVNKKPASFLADSINILSNAWDDSNSCPTCTDLNSRVAADTEINAAFLSGTDTTGGPSGEGVQNSGPYNGGVENYPRFHEKWAGRTLTYRGSFVSLNQPQHVDGVFVFGAPHYLPPIRDWQYDTDFNSADGLPPLAPRFVYLRQELFVRDFDI